MIGLDFDNTIVDYKDVFPEIAYKLGYIASPKPLQKEDIKTIVRKLPDSESKWGLLQAEVYSEGIYNAKIMKGFIEFIKDCRLNEVPVSIVSHKTRFNKYDLKRRNLKKSAMKWIIANKFFDQRGLGFNESQIYFKATPLAKIKCIADLECTYFIDDLEDILLHPSFPTSVTRLLLCSNVKKKMKLPFKVCANWNEVKNYIFSKK